MSDNNDDGFILLWPQWTATSSVQVDGEEEDLQHPDLREALAESNLSRYSIFLNLCTTVGIELMYAKCAQDVLGNYNIPQARPRTVFYYRNAFGRFVTEKHNCRCSAPKINVIIQSGGGKYV